VKITAASATVSIPRNDQCCIATFGIPAMEEVLAAQPRIIVAKMTHISQFVVDHSSIWSPVFTYDSHFPYSDFR
jgi:hypothetical protein